MTKILLRKAGLARYKSGEYTIKIAFKYSPTDVELIKTLPGRKYHKEGRFWTCPPTQVALKMLTEWQFNIDPKIISHIENADNLFQVTSIPGLQGKLFPYQMQGVSFIEAKNGRALVGDDMGLGKTIQAIAWIQLRLELRPVIIVAPASVKLNWKKEIMQWMNAPSSRVEIVTGKRPYDLQTDNSIIIINYDILESWLPELLAHKPKVVIADEIQYVKNGKTKRTKALRKLSRHVPHFIALSGTPIVNKPIEFFNAIQMIDKNVFPNWQTYVRRYCAAKHNGFGLNVNGASNTEELHDVLSSTIMIRRRKKDVLKDLPDKIRSFFPLEMSAAMEQEYLDAETNFLKWMEENRGEDAAERASYAQALAEIEVLKQISVTAKLPHALDWIADFLDTGEKLVVFATHKFVIDAVMKEFEKEAVKIDGSTSGPDRQLAVDKFQDEAKTRLFVGNIQAAGVGITLTAASNVAFLELPWTPGALLQAEDRCHRIGQKDTVNIYYLLAEYTIEEKIAKLLDDKRKILDSVLDGKETDDSDLILELIENY